MFAGLPGASNTISNSSSIRGWLESTGLDDLLVGTCSCILGEEDTMVGDKRVIKAGTTVDGTPLLLQDSSLGIFGIGSSR